MANEELGLKRTCVECGVRFYDLNRIPPVCPKCGAEQRSPERPKHLEDDVPAATKHSNGVENDDDVDIEEDDIIDDDIDDDISSDIEVKPTKDDQDDS
ncbi:TIGR02300 family protein [Formicincola oecophyllae]|uniref:TIGR02300 family protein n=1 Tax=Formicincola oecophyllae TaxID=2558361 RepID=A0A4Y6U9E5_9PROT|nr:FYDLN acid domain-containing protein [Formicincola oecophyllae]QDH13640.1 TIGR02300 family protein [Formicincola oecophyllae]